MLFNLIPLVFVVAFIGIGSKKGFVRELMAFIGLAAALVITTGKLDFIAIEIAAAIDASPLAVSVIAFILVLGLIYAIFKLTARFLYKLVELQKLGQRDKYGGAVIGALRGWMVVGTLVFLTILLPLPQSYYTLLDQSLLAKSAAQSIQLLYDGSSILHPDWPSFTAKLENSLSTSTYRDDDKERRRRRTPERRIKDETALRTALEKVNYYFGDGSEF